MPKEDKVNPSEKIDEMYGYEEPEEEEEEKSIAQQMIEAIKAKRDGMYKIKQKQAGV
jgi:hypothetical protein